jgi:predicted dehydrogenase
MPEDKLKIAVAGAGAFGREHLAALARRDDVVIAGVADPSDGATKSAMAAFGAAQAFADAVAMLDAVRPDGLIVATPGHTHVGIATAALDREIPVLLEKPVGLTAADAEALIAAEARSKAFVLPGHILRFSSPYRRTVKIAQSGELGAILSVTGRNHRDDSHALRYPDIDPVLMTMVHLIDLTLWITGGELQQVLALRRPGDTFRSETLITGSDSAGVMWHISNAWTVPTVEIPPDRVEIVCEAGSVEMELGIAIHVFGRNPRAIDLRAEPPDDMLATELAAFLDGVRRGAHPGVVTLNDARNGLRATDAILRSLATGGVVIP